MLPKHSNPTKFRNDAYAYGFWAWAPYNFVPLPEAVLTVDEDTIPGHHRYAEGTYTGHIECTLTTETPLYTRAALDPNFFRELSQKAAELDDEDKKKMAPFFSMDGGKTPVIPGSSLRGMIRNLVEIISFSKINKVTDEQLLFRAVADRSSQGNYYRRMMLGPNQAKGRKMKFEYPSRNVRAGYLHRTRQGWQIQPAKSGASHFGESFVHVEFRDVRNITHKNDRRSDIYDVWVKPVARQEIQRRRGKLTLIMALTKEVAPKHHDPKPGMVKGKLVVSGWMHGKHMHRIVYEEDKNADPIPIPDEMWDIYVQDRKQARGKPANPGDPIFYLVDNAGNLIFFGNTMMFRLPYDYTPLDMVPEWLREDARPDITESIFGFVSKDQAGKGYASRVFFTDAETSHPEPWLTEDPIAPKVLSTPKPTTFQHYLVQTNPDDRAHLWHWGNKPVKETVIRGNKLYWHVSSKGELNRRKFEAEPERVKKYPKQYTRIKPVKEGVTFTFRVHFENLRDWELGALLWALKLPLADDREYRHKLGMAKPLGLGTVHITVDEVHFSDRKMRYQQLFSINEDGEPSWFETSREVKPDFVKTFIDYVWERLSKEEKKGVKHFYEIERVRMFLEMLAWPGPDSEMTRYMQIQYPDERIEEMTHNEFKERPVLPDPMNITEVDYFLGLDIDSEVSSKIDRIHEPKFRDHEDRNPHTGLTVNIDNHQHKGHIGRADLNHEVQEGRNLRDQYKQNQSLIAWVSYKQQKPKRIGLTLHRPQNPRPWIPTMSQEPEDPIEPPDIPVPDVLEPGRAVEGVILAIENNRLSINIGTEKDASLTYRRIPGIANENDAKARFHVGQKIKAKLLERKRGRWQLTMR